MYQKDIENLQKQIKEMRENGTLNDCLIDNAELAEEQGLGDYSMLEVMAFYLINCHDTITKIASNCTNTLSKSTYDASVYISEIQDYQECLNQRMIKEDLTEILTDEDYGLIETLHYMKEYIDQLKG